MAWKQAVAHLEPNTNPHVLIEPIFDFLSGWAVNDLNVLGPASQSPYCPRIPNCQTVTVISSTTEHYYANKGSLEAYRVFPCIDRAVF